MKPWLCLPPSWSHILAPKVLPLAALLGQGGPAPWKTQVWKQIKFTNPLGIAGGVDKEGTQLLHWQKLGAGFLEVGTVTPLPQSPNPGKIIDRQYKTLSLWNKMGFPNPGAQAVQIQLEKIKSDLKVPLFINIGKNRDTPNETAIEDYKKAYEILKNQSDIFVINISSPNTKGLRDLQEKSQLKNLLSGLRQIASDKKLLLKLSPDMTEDLLKESLDIGIQCSIDGFILTNTTLQRPLELPYPKEGGVSGLPLKDLSRRSLQTAITHLGSNKKDVLIVSVGGILDMSEISWRLTQGADLIQVYAALLYEGPFFFEKAAKHPWQ